MPRYARPDLPPALEAAIEVFGNRVRVAIINTLRHDGPSTRGAIAQRVHAGEQTVLTHLRVLQRHGIITADPPPDEHISGQRVTYTLDLEAARKLYADLGDELGLS